MTTIDLIIILIVIIHGVFITNITLIIDIVEHMMIVTTVSGITEINITEITTVTITDVTIATGIIVRTNISLVTI